jgi:hypothetical protein
MATRLRRLGRPILRTVVARLPAAVADRLRALPLVDSATLAGCFHRALLTALQHGGIPAGITDVPARGQPGAVVHQRRLHGPRPAVLVR